MAALAFLDIGPTEFLLIAGAFLLLFGADRVPDLARTLGRVSAQFRATTRQFQEELDRERGFVDRPGDAVPRDRKVELAQAEQQALAGLREAARALGIDPQGQSEQQLRDAIAARVRPPG